MGIKMYCLYGMVFCMYLTCHLIEASPLDHPEGHAKTIKQRVRRQLWDYYMYSDITAATCYGGCFDATNCQYACVCKGKQCMAPDCRPNNVCRKDYDCPYGCGCYCYGGGPGDYDICRCQPYSQPGKKWSTRWATAVVSDNAKLAFSKQKQN